MKFIWTSGNLTTAKLLWQHGKTGTEIARAIGATRGAVLGKLMREGCLGITSAERSRRQSRANSAAMRAYWQRRREAQCVTV